MPFNDMSMIKASPKLYKYSFVFCFIFTAITSFLSITNQSLWIDEAWTAWLASHPSFQMLIDTQLHTSLGETQKLFHVWYIWAWAQLFGISEYSLRFSNVPFLFVFLLTIQWGTNILFNNRWFWILAGLNPFVWFYMNEARPYIGEIAFSALAIISFLIYLLEPAYRPKLMPYLCLFGLFMASGLVMLGIFIVPSFLVALLWVYKSDWTRWKVFITDWWRPILISLPFFIALESWFVWVTLYKGAAGQVKAPSILNCLFGLYEFFGFLGLGAPRNVIRANPSLHTIFNPDYMLSFLTGIICWTGISFFCLVSFIKRGLPKRIFLLFILFLFGISSFHFIAYEFNFSYWGRHMAQYFPIFILIIIGIVNATFNPNKKQLGYLCIFLLAGIWLLSSVRLVALSQYEKDDYRSTISTVITATVKGGTIFWVADTFAGSYYGLSFINKPLPKVFWPTPYNAINITSSNIDELDHIFTNGTLPIAIAIGKSIPFDSDHIIENKVKQKNAKLISSPNTFKIYLLSN